MSAASGGESTWSLQSDNDASFSKLAFEKSTSLSVLVPTMRRSNNLSDLKVDKLRLDSVSLHGRDVETSTLFHAFESLVDKSSEDCHLCLISGPSGAGKTKLAETLKESATRCKGLFVRGKFDLNLRNQPYSGISNACAEICGTILELQRQDPVLAKEITDEIVRSIDNELSLLVQTIPILAEIVNMSNVTNPDSLSEVSLSTSDAKNRVNFAFVRFFRVMAYHFFPLIFVLDDLQWADASSLDLLEVLMADHQTHKFMLIGIYRSNEVDETHIFHRCLEELHSKSLTNTFVMTKLDIHDLGLEAVNLIIQDSLQCDDSRTLGLAEVCFKKTHGNPFYLIHFLSMLYENQWLQFNYGTLSWIWNNEEIELSTRASDNVVDLLQNRMMELPDHMLDILNIAACLGSTFEQRLLQFAWSKFFNATIDLNSNYDFESAIDDLIKQEVLVKISETPRRIGWVHDKIHEAAIALVSPSERQKYYSRVGEILASELTEDELDSAIFVIVDLLKGSSTGNLDDPERFKRARLNLKASQKAVRLSAFESAAKYAGEGIALLPGTAWDDDYELCLGLYSIGAKAESFVGNVVVMEKYCQAVLAQEHKPIEDKFDVYNTLVDNIANQGKVVEAANLVLEILGKFNCRFPTNPVLIGLEVLYNVVKIQMTMKSRKTSELPLMRDTVRVNLMQLLDKLFTCFYMMKDDRMALVVFRCVNWTMKYGNCPSSAPGFALTGMILTGTFGDLQGGSTYGQHALTLLNNSQSMSTAARTMFCVYSFLFSWTQQSRMTLKPLLQGYDFGLRTGQTESAAFAIYHWLAIRYNIGSPLECLEADVSLYLKQMIDLKRGQAVKLLKSLHQGILNLMGGRYSDDPMNFSGKAISEDDYNMAQKDPYWMASLYTYRGPILTYFGEHISNADTLHELGHNYLLRTHPGSPNNMVDMYLKGVSCFAAARQTRKRKYAKLAKICQSKVKKWLDLGNPNVKHYVTFLDAEAMALKGKRFSAIQHYEMTILQAGRVGYQQDAALASERLGEYQLSVMNDHEEGAFRLREAEKYWRGWGAFAKVQHLIAKYPQFFCTIPTGEIFTLNTSEDAVVKG